MQNQRLSLYSVCKKFKIKYSSGKAILKRFRKEGRISDNRTRQFKKGKLNVEITKWPI